MIARGARRHVRQMGLAAIVFAGGVAILAGFLVLAGYDAGAALAALWRGAFGSWDAVASATLVRAAPLITLGLAFALAQRGGALNIGMEGQFMLGATGAVVVGTTMQGMPAVVALPLTMLGGLIAGAAWMLVPVLLRWRYGVTEVISTLLLTFVADAFVNWCITGPLQETSGTYPQSDMIASAARLPRLVSGTRLHAGVVLTLALSVSLAIFFRRSAWAFRLRAVGANATAARISGRIDPGRMVAVALLASGALAGLGGAMEVSGVSYALYQNLSPGYGFTAIAVALLGRLQPLAIVAAGLLFGALEAGAGAMQRDAGIPAVAVQVVEAFVILLMIILSRPTRAR